ncbi:MAG: dTDP-4-amino-4,6-dideoxygalactose transaminase [Maritimibacter sp.]|nr:dTDP-4-amino-4,6-dideoxygalactose transaminase [Maritimibacter sp.]
MTLIPFNKPSLVGNEIEYLRDAIRRGQLSGDGYYTGKCNARIAAETNGLRALITHSCTAALEMAAMLCDLGPGDEVILPSFTFVSTANAIVLRGAVPVFVDVLANTLNIDPVRVEAAVTARTKAIFAVHYAGFPADMDALAAIAERHGLWLVEDAAQAFGSTYKGRRAGGLADIGAISFHETKNVISGEGGAIIVNRPELVQRAEIIREKGTNRSQFFRGEVDKYTWVDVGSSYLPGELIASYLFAQLEMADEVTARRKALFARYHAAFAPLEAAGRLRRPRWVAGSETNGHMYYLLLRDQSDRDRFIDHMRAQEIGTPFHYVPLHSSPAGKRFGRTSGSVEVTERTWSTLVRLPMFYELGAQIDQVIERALEYFSRVEANRP